MKTLFTLILLSFLFGCSTDYVKPTQYEDTVIITWHRSDDADDDCRKQGVDHKIKYTTLGCASWRTYSPDDAAALIKRLSEKKQSMVVCNITSPQVQYDHDDNMMILGHEANHCFTGRFHD